MAKSHCHKSCFWKTLRPLACCRDKLLRKVARTLSLCLFAAGLEIIRQRKTEGALRKLENVVADANKRVWGGYGFVVSVFFAFVCIFEVL